MVTLVQYWQRQSGPRPAVTGTKWGPKWPTAIPPSHEPTNGGKAADYNYDPPSGKFSFHNINLCLGLRFNAFLKLLHTTSNGEFTRSRVKISYDILLFPEWRACFKYSCWSKIYFYVRVLIIYSLSSLLLFWVLLYWSVSLVRALITIILHTYFCCIKWYNLNLTCNNNHIPFPVNVFKRFQPHLVI